LESKGRHGYLEANITDTLVNSGTLTMMTNDVLTVTDDDDDDG